MATELSGYRTVGQLGVGARSTISQVVRVTTGQFFALKRVVRRGPDDDRFLEQVENEYKVAGSTDHPNLRKCFELHRVKRWFKTQELLLLMEYVPGKSLEQERPGDLKRTIDLARKVATGLAGLHEAGYVHADIKPNNILITTDDDVKIVDFGQSCRIGHKKTRIQGTPDYIAPEQVRRLPLDQRTDVFNLGATFYWVLTNSTFPTDIHPGRRGGGHEIKGFKRAPKDIVPSIPAALSALVMDCCASSPDKRPGSMQQVIARLDVAERLLERSLIATDNHGAGAEPTDA